MKRTKNMYYEVTEESRELVLVAENDGALYALHIKPLIINLQQKYDKGIYDADKAVDAYYRIATLASDKYYRDFGYRFSVQQRFTAAVQMEQDFRDCVIP